MNWERIIPQGPDRLYKNVFESSVPIVGVGHWLSPETFLFQKRFGCVLFEFFWWFCSFWSVFVVVVLC